MLWPLGGLNKAADPKRPASRLVMATPLRTVKELARKRAEPAAGAKFECKLDNARWAKCSSPKTYKKLKVGKHTFRVRAIASGRTGAVATFKFTVTA